MLLGREAAQDALRHLSWRPLVDWEGHCARDSLLPTYPLHVESIVQRWRAWSKMIALAIEGPATRIYSSFQGTMGLLKSTRPNNLNLNTYCSLS